MSAMRAEDEIETLEWKIKKSLELQHAAPEVLGIRVLSVEKKPPSHEARETEVRVATLINVKAVVTHVARSTAGIELHDTIRITYQDWEYGDGAAGGMIYNPISLKVDDEVRAYLQPGAEGVGDPKLLKGAASFLSFDPYWAKHQSSSNLVDYYRKYLRDLLW